MSRSPYVVKPGTDWVSKRKMFFGEIPALRAAARTCGYVAGLAKTTFAPELVIW